MTSIELQALSKSYLGMLPVLDEVSLKLDPGEFYIVPRKVEHRPVCQSEVHVLLVEPASTLNTGNIRNERTVETPKQI